MSYHLDYQYRAKRRRLLRLQAARSDRVRRVQSVVERISSSFANLSSSVSEARQLARSQSHTLGDVLITSRNQALPQISSKPWPSLKAITNLANPSVEPSEMNGFHSFSMAYWSGSRYNFERCNVPSSGSDSCSGVPSF
jgi:hypothetical protein